MKSCIAVTYGAALVASLCSWSDVKGEQFWGANGGQATLMLNHEPLRELGVFVSEADAQASQGASFSVIQARVLPQPTVTFEVVNQGVTELFGRTLRFDPGLRILCPSGEYVVYEMTLVDRETVSADAVRQERDLRLSAARRADGPTLLLTEMKRGFDWRNAKLKFFSQAMILSEPLARELGDPALAGVPIGSVMLMLETHWISGEQPERPAPTQPDPAGSGQDGPDVTFCQLYQLLQYGRLGDIVGLAVATTAWNIGDEVVDWLGPPNARHPFIVMNLFRLKDDRFEQIGQSWIKHAFCALDNAQCGGTCIPTGCPSLGLNCTDTYSSPLNASQAGLGPRYEVNPWTGEWDYWTSHLSQGYHSHNPIEHRLQVRDADLKPLENPGATYYVESFYCTYDDPHVMNNTAWKPVTPYRHADVPERWVFEMTDAPVYPNIGFAIDAWEGATQTVLAQEVPPIKFVSPDGRCVLATKVTELPGGERWHYEYALLNVDMDREVKSFRIPLPVGASLTEIGFHAVESHDEPYSNDAWTPTVTADAITWVTDYNPVRWGTLYNFRFNANRPAGPGTVTLGLNKPGTPEVVTGSTQVPTLFGPYIVHGRPGDSFEVCAFSGYVDSRMESSDGTVVDLGLSQITITFSEPVQGRGGGPLTINSFLVRQTGEDPPPNIAAVATADNQTVTIILDRPITLQEWTTVQCKVQNLSGIPIESPGDLGPGVLEPDRIDVGFLSANVNQNEVVSVVDLIKFRQYLIGTAEPAAGIIEDYVDTTRDGMVAPVDLINFRQLLMGTGKATKPWAGETMNHPQP